MLDYMLQCAGESTLAGSCCSIEAPSAVAIVSYGILGGTAVPVGPSGGRCREVL